jgi:hypothetical protein
MSPISQVIGSKADGKTGSYTKENATPVVRCSLTREPLARLNLTVESG